MRRTAPASIAAVAVALHLLAASAAAQPSAPGLVHRFEASFGGLWINGAPLGSQAADLRANNLSPEEFTLFTTESTSGAAPGFDAKVTFWLTRAIAVEAGFVRARPELRTEVRADAEGAAPLTVAETLDQYFIDAGAVWLIERLTLGGAVPFVSGGAGYLRQLHEGRTLVETGQVYHAGGGLRHTLLSRASGAVRRLGLRLDARAYVLVDGVQLDESPRTHAAFSGSVFVAF